MVLDMSGLLEWLRIVPRPVLNRLAVDVNVVVMSLTLPRTLARFGCWGQSVLLIFYRARGKVDIAYRRPGSVDILGGEFAWQYSTFYEFEVVRFGDDSAIYTCFGVHDGGIEVVEVGGEVDVSIG